MSQRISDYTRRADEDYATPAWVGHAIATPLQLINVRSVWEPATGAGKLARALRLEGFHVAETKDDFLKRSEPPEEADAIVTNPPYGEDRRSDLACAFIRHALDMPVDVVAMLLRVDFDSAKTRVDLFRDNRRFAGKIVLLDRIVWFERKGAAPSDNHAWFIWDGNQRRRYPWTRYVAKQ
jgi:hypothetical protein